jgi:hypothetical protein
MQGYHKKGGGYYGDNGPDPVRPEIYRAYCGGSYVDWADTLPQLLALLEEVAEKDEDICVWQGSKIIAVRLAAGLTVVVSPARDAGKAGKDGAR